MSTNSYSGYKNSYADPNSTSYSSTENYRLYMQLDQLAFMVRSQQESIWKFLRNKSTVDAVKRSGSYEKS